MRVARYITVLDHYRAHGIEWMSVLLVVCIAYFLAEATWPILMPPTVEPMTIPSASKLPTQTAAVDIHGIQSWNLFGVLGASLSQTTQTAQVETQLQLTLQGVFRAPQADNSTAIIAQLGDNGVLYRIHDSLPGGAILDQVFDDHVVLSRNGALETLKFPQPDAVLEATRNDAQSSWRHGTEKTTKTQVGQLLAQANKPDEKEFIEALKIDLQKDPTTTLHELGLTPRTANQGGGYFIASAASDEWMTNAGLKQGDVVRSINGHSLGEVASDRLLYQSFLSSPWLQVEVQRGVRRFSVRINVPQS